MTKTASGKIRQEPRSFAMKAAARIINAIVIKSCRNLYRKTLWIRSNIKTFSIVEIGKNLPSLFFHWIMASFMNSQRVQPFVCKTAERMELGMSSPLKPDWEIGSRKNATKVVGTTARKNTLFLRGNERIQLVCLLTTKTIVGFNQHYEFSEEKLLSILEKMKTNR